MKVIISFFVYVRALLEMCQCMRHAVFSALGGSAVRSVQITFRGGHEEAARVAGRAEERAACPIPPCLQQTSEVSRLESSDRPGGRESLHAHIFPCNLVHSPWFTTHLTLFGDGI